MKSKRGFTLLELILVIAILGIISAVAIPKFIDMQKKAQFATDEANAKLVGDVLNRAVLDGKVDYVIDKNGKWKRFKSNNVTFTGSGTSFEKVFVPEYIDKMIFEEGIRRIFQFDVQDKGNYLLVNVVYDPDPIAKDTNREATTEPLYKVKIPK